MVRLTEAQLKSWTNELTFRRAKQYYKDGYVEDLKIQSLKVPGIKKSDITSIQSKVISFNGFNTYTVAIEINNNTGQIEGDCSCAEYEEDFEEGPCKHVTAVLLKYINEAQSGKVSEGRKSDIDDLLQEFKAFSEADEDFKRELNMEVKFFRERHMKPYIELKIGLEKNYVVKGMRNFLEHVLKGESLEFGKNFTYDPVLHKFNEIDDKLMEMFLEIRDMEGERPHHSYDYFNTYNNSMFNGKKLLLTDKLIYRFFKLAKDRKLDAVIDGKEYTGVSIIEGHMPLQFKLGMTKETIELAQLSMLPEPLDGYNKVFWYEGNIYMPPREQINVYMPIYNLLAKRKSKKVVFNKQEGEKIASYILPKLRAAAEEVALDKEVRENFYEAPLTIKTYLDKQDNVVTAEVKFLYGDVEIEPLKDNRAKQENRILIRDISKEENSELVLKSFGFERENQLYAMKNEKDIVSFITEGINKLQGLGEVYYSDSFRDIKVYGKSSLKGGIRLNEENLLEFSFELEGVDRSELKNIFNALREKKKYYRLKNGGFVSLEDRGMRDLGEMIDYLDIKDKDLSKEKLILSKYNAVYLDQKIKDKDMDYVKRSRNFRDLANNLRDVRDMDYSLPDHLDRIMRNYQKTGFKWFKTLAAYGFGGILADEMGLGKTLQTIAFLATERGESPSMVVAPTSLVYNWQSEIEKFAPELKTVVISGSKKQREELMNEIKDCDVVITSYPLIRRDIEEYKDISFNYCFLDEAQQIKNPGSMNASSVKEIKAKGYFALTGTPIENSLTELWSIFDFIMPGYMLTHNKFSKLYETPIIKNNDSTALDELNRHIKPFILRRLKKDVIKELPPKIEHKLVVEMTEEQKKLYAAYLASAKNEINEEIRDKGFSKSKIKILSILTRLRQICCDPSVFVEGFTGESGKLTALDDILEESIGQGHKILLFSQFTSVLKNISKRLGRENIKFMYLDGNTKSEDRMSLVKEFNEGDASLFLISLKAGGTGLNLTGADVVIHFDPWWNPAVEEQATDRAHRIGQQKTVEVIKLLAQGTIEEKIFNLQQKKKEIIKSVINEDMSEENMITQMTHEDIESLFA
jgi:SNF2 family DNA or RNA helicase